MAKTRPSDCFYLNEFFWKMFGLWPGRTSSKYYKYYSVFYLFFTLIIYIILLTLNIMFTPGNIELLVREVIFYFTEVAVFVKVFMIIFKRKQILESFVLLDGDIFKGDDDATKLIVESSLKQYVTVWKFYAILANFAYSIACVLPIVVYLILDSSLELPICQYYFLSEEVREKYLTYWYLYQTGAMYGHMMYNVNIDSFISGLIFMCVTQLKVINYKLKNLKLGPLEITESVEVQEKLMLSKLNQCLKHYGVVLEYYYGIQDIINVAMFVQLGISSIIVCVVLYRLTLPTATDTIIFLVCYLSVIMGGEIIVPCWLGTELNYENGELVLAAYHTDWIPRSERFKQNLRLFVARANSPLVLKGMHIFPLTLTTVTSIMKTAYSMFTLLRNVQDRDH